jgi:hypothetical protein
MTYVSAIRTERPLFVSFVVRFVFCAGAIIAFWLIAASAASADEPITGTAVTTDAPAATATESTNTTTTAVDEPAATATDAVGSAGDAVTDAVGAANDAAGSVERATKDAADNAADTVTNSAVASSVDDAAGAMADVTTGAAGDAVSTVTDSGTAAIRTTNDTMRTVDDLSDGSATVDRTLADIESDVSPTLRRTGGGLVGATGSVQDVGGVPTQLEAGDPVPAWELVDERRRVDVESIIGSTPRALAIQPAFASAPGVGVANPRSSSGEEAPNAPDSSEGTVPPTGMSARDSLRGGSSFSDVAAILAAMFIALGLVRWSRRESEMRYSPVFLSLAGHPG